MRRSFLSLFAVAATLPLLAVAQGTASKATRVVVQVSDGDPARWNMVLNNVKNVQDALGAGNVTVEIVAYGPGIGMLKADAPTSARLSEAIKGGVAVEACENTMRGFKLTRAEMNPAIGYVPAGTVQIIKREQEGWAYLRP
jgi:intracellular sulfur oxidation DsrE/DsrF family protein